MAPSERSMNTLIIAAVSSAAAITFYAWRWNVALLQKKLDYLESSLQTALQNRAAERKGRIRAEQALREALIDKTCEASKSISYPMHPIGIIQSCFSLRNGTPRQPLLVTNSRACLLLHTDTPPAAFEGITKYSHCWIIYVFHKNTDLTRLWQQSGHSSFKAKVRVPRLQGVKMGVFATRSPHRLCPIGLSVAKIEGLHGRMLLLSGVDLVDGTPVLDIKPYLPYCDNVPGATVPDWIKEEGKDDQLAVISIVFSPSFSNSLARCWELKGKHSLYQSSNAFQELVKQVLSRDIRSFSQRVRPHKIMPENLNVSKSKENVNLVRLCEGEDDESAIGLSQAVDELVGLSGDTIEYHLLLEGIDVVYTIDADKNVVVQSAEVSLTESGTTTQRCNHIIWSKVISNS